MEELLNIDDVTITGTLAVIVLVTNKLAEIVAKTIPDTATGWKGTLRKVCKILGTYVVNNDK